jgi:L-threonylcarbamoyladenylate synthase
VGVVAFGHPNVQWPKASESNISHINLTNDPLKAAAQLYDTFHKLDQLNLDLILVEEPPKTPEWAAIGDRLKRAVAED